MNRVRSITLKENVPFRKDVYKRCQIKTTAGMIANHDHIRIIEITGLELTWIGLCVMIGVYKTTITLRLTYTKHFFDYFNGDQ